MNHVAVALIVLAGVAQAQRAPSDDPMHMKAQDFVLLFVEGRFEDAPPMMDTTMNTAMPPAAAEQMWSQFIAQVGAFRRILAVADIDHPTYRTVTVLCEFANAKVTLRVVFSPEGLVGGFFMTPPADADSIDPPYADRDAFTESETEVVTGDIRLPATLAIPNGDGPFPVVVLVHGSGPNDRDETLGPNKVFRDLAWGLATLSVASLRYEKRTRAAPEKLNLKTLTYREETVDDALSALALAADDPRFDADRVVVLGHSFGASLAPLIAKESPHARGAILMAASTEDLIEAILRQTEYIFMSDNALSDAESSQLQAIRDAASKLDAGDASPSVFGGVTQVYIDALDAYDGPAIAQELDVPILVAQGARDYQVLADTSFADWRNALEGRANATFKLYPALDHLFMSGDGPSYPRDYQRARNVSEEFVRDVAEWVKALGD
jgi:uncharacterized protein